MEENFVVRRGKATENAEFQEEEVVWASSKDGDRNMDNSSSSGVKKMNMKMRKPSPSSSSSSSSVWPLPRRLTQRKNCRVDDHKSTSPMKIPDWSSKIYQEGNEEDGEEEDEGMVPPHEYIARRLARTQIASFSMCEGIGRTLKGRDLSKVRNAILTKTGFLEG
ncbi:unnamed protein product [Cuscuta europaea]|uniref:Senescence regulator n=1 Tax=Cuscuta europaea TaxID=41803 RepID=A0A9P0Z0J6_CUSEU|nr:unnamed protein product [Cuscuta europaea]